MIPKKVDGGTRPVARPYNYPDLIEDACDYGAKHYLMYPCAVQLYFSMSINPRTSKCLADLCCIEMKSLRHRKCYTLLSLMWHDQIPVDALVHCDHGRADKLLKQTVKLSNHSPLAKQNCAVNSSESNK